MAIARAAPLPCVRGSNATVRSYQFRLNVHAQARRLAVLQLGLLWLSASAAYGHLTYFPACKHLRSASFLAPLRTARSARSEAAPPAAGPACSHMSQASAVGAIADVFIGAVEPPSDATAVHKSECAFSFVTPEDEGGLYLNMRTFTAVSEEFLVADAGGDDRTAAYLHMRSTKKAKTTKAAAELTKVAIGVEGGAPTEAVEWEHHYALVVMPGARRVELTGSLPHPELSDKVNMFISRLIEHDDASKQVRSCIARQPVARSGEAVAMPGARAR